MTRAGWLASVALLVGLGLNLALWAGTWWAFPRSNPTAILHYNASSGIDIIGQGSRIGALPVAGLLFLVCNSVLGWLLYRTEPRLAWFLWLVIPVVQLVLLTSFVLLRHANLTFIGN